MPMNLSHALDHHPLRGERVWGVRLVYKQNGIWEYATGYGAWTIGRLPTSGLTLRMAFSAYVNALQGTSTPRIHLFRMVGCGDNVLTIDDEGALSFAGYTNPSDEHYSKLRQRGAKLPEFANRPQLTGGSPVD